MHHAYDEETPGFSDPAELWEEQTLIDWNFDERIYCTLSDELQFLHEAVIEEILYSPPTDAYSAQQASPGMLLEAISCPDMVIKCVAF